MSDWIPLDVGALLADRVEKLSGADARVTTSGYDIPSAYKVSYLSGEGLFEIQFKYVLAGSGQDAEIEVDVSSDLKFFVGRQTGRILRIRVKTAPASKSLRERQAQLATTLEGGFEGLERRRQMPRRPENYRVARTFIKQRSNDIWRQSRQPQVAVAR